jgi:hypothetical protein
MEHDIDAVDCITEGNVVGKVARHNFNLVQYRAEIFQRAARTSKDSREMAISNECFDKIASDETGAAKDKEFLFAH